MFQCIFSHLGRWKERNLCWHISNGCQCVLFSPGGSHLSLSLSHHCKFNGTKSWAASPTIAKAPSVLLALAYRCGDDSTHSYVPLHQWKAKQQLTAVMRTTISSTHNQVLSPVQVTVEYISPHWKKRSKISPHTCHSSCYTLFTRWYSGDVTVHTDNKVLLATCRLVLGVEKDGYTRGTELFGQNIEVAKITLVICSLVKSTALLLWILTLTNWHFYEGVNLS